MFYNFATVYQILCSEALSLRMPQSLLRDKQKVSKCFSNCYFILTGVLHLLSELTQQKNNIEIEFPLSSLNSQMHGEVHPGTLRNVFERKMQLVV